MKKTSLLILLSLFFMGCGGGPAEDSLRGQVQQRLNENFERGLFEVAEFDRRGSQPYTDENDGSAGVIVYYKAQIKFLKNYKLSNWNSLNVGSLISVLGAAPSGVTGVNPTGNTAGDSLEVFGLQAYVKQGDGWDLASIASDHSTNQGEKKQRGYVSEIDAVEEKYFAMDAPWYKSYVQDLQTTARSLGRDGHNQVEARLRSDLTRVLTRAQLAQAKFDQQVTFLSGSLHGDYFALGRGVKSLPKPPSLQDLVVLPSDGSITNLRLVKDGLATFAMAQSDIAAMSYGGTAEFSGLANSHLRAVGALYPEAVQVIVRGDAGIATFADLQGKRINIGPLGSGGHSNAEQVLKAHGVNPATLYRQTTETAVLGLQQGELDAIVITSAYPSRVLQSLKIDVDILGLETTAIANLVAHHGLIPITIPANTYQGIDHAVSTVGVTALLVTSEETQEQQVLDMMDTIYGNVKELSKASVPASQITPEHARQGIGIPLHPAAEKYFARQ